MTDFPSLCLHSWLNIRSSYSNMIYASVFSGSLQLVEMDLERATFSLVSVDR